MIDKNIDIRKAYYDILNNKVKYNGTNIPIYNGFVTNDNIQDYYILIQGQNSIGIEAKNNQLREMSLQLVIHTRLTHNNGWECDKIASEVLRLIYPNRVTQIKDTLSTKLISDNTLSSYDSVSKKQIYERIIIFNHIY